ncbi:hypothetical protein J7K50_08495 [bacterium]|nr:hypothetical protein [bacterium]
MTLCVAIEASDAIILASDSRGLVGDPRGPTMANDTNIKVVSFSPGTGLAVAGTAEFAATILHDMPQHLDIAMANPLFKDKPRDVHLEAKVLHEVAKSTYEKWFNQAPSPNRPPLIFLLCGYADNKPNLITLMSLFDFAPGKSTTGFQTIGVNMLATYLLNRLYCKGISADAAIRLAYYVIDETKSQDGKVGGPIHIGVIRADKDLEMLDETRLDDIRQNLVSFSVTLRGHFGVQEERKEEV